jgi:HAD superfamily hydrolase (TIGR01490 family)
MTEKKKIAVFDLNLTFYNKSSKDAFYLFLCSKKPKRIKYYLQMLYYKLLLKLHKINQTEFKENFFNYLDGISPEQVEAYAREFWNNEYPGNFNKALKQRFEQLKKEGVQIVCATGGLELYVKPLFDLYPINAMVGTRVKYENGTYLIIGKACKKEEKLCRINEYYKDQDIEIVEAYSDSHEDILNSAKKAYLIRNGELVPLENQEK